MRELLPGISLLERTWGSNVYVLHGDPATLVDAGFPMDARRLVKELGESGLRPGLMAASHYHIDHTGPMAKLKSLYGADVAAHIEDAKVLEGFVPYERFKVEPLKTSYYRALSPLFRFHLVEVDEKLKEGDVLDALGGLEVIHVPGHTDGSIVLCQRDLGVVFTGDTIRNENGVLEGPPPRFSPGIEESYWHIREKILSLDFEVLLPGHGEPVMSRARLAVRNMMGRMGRTT